MKKIDLHLHTKPAAGKDAQFVFDASKFEQYTKALSIDAVAITNHNLFDKTQFAAITKKLTNTVVFPGIELDFESGHLLLIADTTAIADFATRCDLIPNELKKGAFITISTLKSIFGDLHQYLLIPHYDKNPKIKQTVLDQLREYIFAGEVASPKKFNRIIKERESLTPVLFSDARISADLDIDAHQGRHTFIQTKAVSLANLKLALKDKNKVFLSNTGKRDFFQVFQDGQELSNGLNVVLGGRSSGKTFFLDRLNKAFNPDGKSIKYIRQFDLVKEDEDKFNELVEKEKSEVRENYLEEFQTVVADAIAIDRRGTNHKLEKYIETLVEFASNEKLHDEYSNAALFKETPFRLRYDTDLEKLIKATKVLLETDSYKQVVSKYLPEDNLRQLLADLETRYRAITEERLRQSWVNEVIENISQKLKQKTASPNIQYNEIAFYDVNIEREKVKRFNAIGYAIKKSKIVDENPSLGKFKIQALAGEFEGAGELVSESRRKLSFAPAFRQYASPINFLEELKAMSGLEKSELYRYFCKVTYHVLNQYGKKVSGGERAEFNLLKALRDARQYEILLVDEPESSFDNLFLKDNVNKEIKDLSAELPVVVVTHNNTVGMLMYPSYIIYAQRTIVDSTDEYRIFSGSPGDKELKTADGETIDSHGVLMDTLEAGEKAYDTRRELYKGFKN